MNDRYFDLGNFAVNNELDADADVALVEAYFGAVTDRRLARLRLMKMISDLREAMWGVVQAGHQHARRRLPRLRRASTSTGCLENADYGPGSRRACSTDAASDA